APAFSPAVGARIALADGLPGIASPVNSMQNRFRLLDAYVSWTWRNYQFSFGTQSLWWGPGQGSAFLFTNNSEPILMFRVRRAAPFKLPGPLRFMGPVETEAMFGRLEGHQN